MDFASGPVAEDKETTHTIFFQGGIYLRDGTSIMGVAYASRTICIGLTESRKCLEIS